MDWKKTFSQLEPALLDAMEKEAVVKAFPAGEIILKPGQYIRSAMLVLEGRIKIYREHEDGGEFLMYYLQPGEACAISMICALHSQVSEVMAKTEQDTTVLMLPISVAEEFMGRFKTWNQFVIQTYRKRFEDLLQVIDHVAFRNMDERLEFYLKRHARVTGKKTIELSHQQIAEDLNTSREVISRLLKKMEQGRYLRLHRNMIELL